ncbi:MAG: glutamate-cysteine ligase family protein [Myxococcota bacterium]
MSRDMKQNTIPIEEREQMLEFFRSGEKPDQTLHVGTEHEKFVFHKDTGRLADHEDLARVMGDLAERYDWEPAYDRGKLIALEGSDGAVTLEPGGQLELSGALRGTVFETAAEFDRHMAQLHEVAAARLNFAAWGANPFDELDDIPWMPKSRYAIMRRYLPTRGDLAHHMMKRTCTVQANFDYTSEEDAVDILRTSLYVSPIVSAMFANSPIVGGRDVGMQSYRLHIWTRTDPDRTGFPDFMFRDDWGYEEYLDYVLDIPMFFIRRGSAYLDATGRTFREFMRDGFEGARAHMGDFELHLSTVFPEVRMKRYIEVRGADAGSRAMMMALPAVWKGILYDATARADVRALRPSTTPSDHRGCFEVVTREAIRANTTCGSFLHSARDLVAIARAGLDRIAERDGHRSEAVFLEPLEQLLSIERTHADRFLKDWAAFGGDRRALIQAYAL